MLSMLSRHGLWLLRRDVRETLSFWCHRRARRAAAGALRSCTSSEDLFRFTHDRLVRPAAQNESEIVRFVDAAKNLQPSAVCEIGVQDGGTNFILSHGLPSVNTMIALDLHVCLKCQLRYFRRPGLQLALIDGSSQSARARRRVAHALASRPLDVLFIDGDHSFSGALRDFQWYRHFVRDGGLIAFHDIVPDSFTRHGIRTEASTGGVPLLWSVLSPLYRCEEFIDDPNQDGRGIGVLYYDRGVMLPDDVEQRATRATTGR